MSPRRGFLGTLSTLIMTGGLAAGYGTLESFVALSSVCPYLGYAVHWESQNNRFFCLCHNGAFDSVGMATEGPPATAKQSLTKFPAS